MIIAIAGMPGAGKSTAAKILEGMGFHILRFGDITDIMLRKEGMEINEKNERYMRERLRMEHGMGAYAKLNIERIRLMMKESKVVIDGMRSWQEYEILDKEFGDELKLVAIDSSDAVRHKRLGLRADRGLSAEEAKARDDAEKKKLGTDVPVQRAKLKIDNNHGMERLKSSLIELVDSLQ